MKIKIVQRGWETFSGDLGGTQFVNAVSVEDVEPIARRRISAIVLVEDVEGGQIGPAVDIVNAHSIPADKAKTYERITEADREAELKQDADKAAKRREEAAKAAVEQVKRPKKKPGTEVYTQKTEFDPVAAAARKYTRADLEKIADDEGMSGLRPIAASKNIKGKSIEGLIDAIVDHDGTDRVKPPAEES